jgi:hypothetical protein
MRFQKFLNNININISSESNIKEDEIFESFKSSPYYSEVIKIINDLNKDLSLKNNKNKFTLTECNEIPSVKNRDEILVIEK